MEETKKRTGISTRIKKFFTKRLWDADMSRLGGIRGAGVAFLRVLITVVGGIFTKRILVQASSLSYATLLAIGPILAIIVMFAGVFFRGNQKMIYEKIMDAATFVMPAFNQMIQTTPAQGGTAEINPEIFEFIDKISQSGAKAGTIGMFAMLITCLLLCTNMESAFNYIWGVKKGRKWVNRIVFYFAMIFFGSVGSIFGMTFFATSQLSKFLSNVPFVAEYLTGSASWIAFILGFAVMTSVLASFYKLMPLVRVKWKAAFIGAAITMVLLVLNNKGSFIYISYIAKQQSLYGYLAIVAVAMFSLYIFWTLILTGGQIAFAAQYVDFLSDDDAWEKMGCRARKICALAVFSEIERAFYGAEPQSPTIEAIIHGVKMPKAAVLEALALLQSRSLVCVVRPSDDVDCEYFKPAISPESLTLAEFFERLSLSPDDADTIKRLAAREPLVAAALPAYAAFAASENGSKNLKQLLS